MKLYDYKTVEEYITREDLWECTEVVQGCLVDNYFIYHEDGTIEVFEEKALNTWSSACVRHIYRKGLPKRLQAMLEEWNAYIEEREKEEEEERYRNKALRYAEQYGIIEYYVDGNEMIYYSSYPLEHSTVKAIVNLDTMNEERKYLKKYYKAYGSFIGGRVQANYCI